MPDSTRPTRAVDLGFVDLQGDVRPQAGKTYPIVSAASDRLALLAYPQTRHRLMNLDVYSFFVDSLPDFWLTTGEGLLKIQASTRDPQNLSSQPADVSFATEFEAKARSYAPSFLFRGVYRNLVIRDGINLRFDLFELDTDTVEYYNKIKQVIDKVPEIKALDVLNGIPYLSLATKLFDGIITTFGRNPDDHVWGELPTVDLEPTAGGAFLRDGIYVLFEIQNSKREQLAVTDLQFRDGRIATGPGIGKLLPNHLIFGAKLLGFQAGSQSARMATLRAATLQPIEEFWPVAWSR